MIPFKTFTNAVVAEDEKEEDEEEIPDSNTLVEVSEVSSGGAFGEMSLIHGAPRAATITCKKETWIGILEKTDYYDILGKHDLEVLDQKIKFLQKIPLFTKWSKTSVNRLLFHIEEVTYKTRQVVYNMFDEPR
jgi:CRP-like cAMP-binding protein